MKVGLCCGMERAALIKSCGYDYIEENLAKIAALTESEFLERVRFYRELDLEVYAFNCFFPKNITMYSENYLNELESYADAALARATALGGKICVLGSGAQRNIPQDADRAAYERKFDKILSICGKIAAKYGLRIAIEPLSRSETNLINTVAEAAEAARRTGLSNVGALVDFYHFYRNQDTEESLVSARDVLLHAHLARPNADRLMPTAEDMDAVKAWGEMLRKIDYRGAMSVEARYGEDFDATVRERTKHLQILKNW